MAEYRITISRAFYGGGVTVYAKFFKAPTYSSLSQSWSTFTNDRLFATDRIVSYEYTERLTKIGTFTMVLPFDKALLSKLEINGTIYYDGCWLWVQGISYDGKSITLTGTDMKGLLGTRVSLYSDEPQFAGTQGYDVVEGNASVCLAHYIQDNCVRPFDSNRLLPFVRYSVSDFVGHDGEGPRMTTSYMARLEFLSDIADKLCDSAAEGYRVFGNLTGYGFKVMTFQGVDRSHTQNERPRVIFAVSRRNIKSIQCEHSVSDLYNAVYAIDSNEVVIPVYRDMQSSGGGSVTLDTYLKRRECSVTVSGTTYDDDFYKAYAMREVESNTETHSFTIEAAVSSGYGTAYQIGDYVTILDDYTGNMEKSRITEVTKSYAAGQQNITLVFGTPKQKPLQKIVNGFLSGTLKRR